MFPPHFLPPLNISILARPWSIYVAFNGLKIFASACGITFVPTASSPAHHRWWWWLLFLLDRWLAAAMAENITLLRVFNYTSIGAEENITFLHMFNYSSIITLLRVTYCTFERHGLSSATTVLPSSYALNYSLVGAQGWPTHLPSARESS